MGTLPGMGTGHPWDTRGFTRVNAYAPPDSPIASSAAMNAVSQTLFVFTYQSLMSLDDCSPREAYSEKAAVGKVAVQDCSLSE